MNPVNKSHAPEGSRIDCDWTSYADEQLLEVRICDLNLKIQGTDLESRIQTLYAELDDRKIAFKPICYLGDEWFCPDGACTIAIPFYLSHTRLIKLEERMMMEVEGGTEGWCMQLLRHEMGHVINHAYLLGRKRDWQKMFGSPSTEYSEFYRARPYSKRFVQHLDDWYAQSHPEEDFAETFAIWLTQGLDWRTKYRGWKALEKLEYVDRLMQNLAGQSPLAISRKKICEASRLRSPLKKYYNRRRRLYAQYFPDFFDSDLRRLFIGPPTEGGLDRASTFLRRNRKAIMDAVATWTGEPKFTINRLLRALTTRCAELDLRLRKDVSQSGMEIAAYLASLASNYRLTGKFKRS